MSPARCWVGVLLALDCRPILSHTTYDGRKNCSVSSRFYLMSKATSSEKTLLAAFLSTKIELLLKLVFCLFRRPYLQEAKDL